VEVSAPGPWFALLLLEDCLNSSKLSSSELDEEDLGTKAEASTKLQAFFHFSARFAPLAVSEQKMMELANLHYSTNFSNKIYSVPLLLIIDLSEPPDDMHKCREQGRA